MKDGSMKNMDCKYYVPEISEFHVGFEYEKKYGFSDGTVKTKEQYDLATWNKEIFLNGFAPYIERSLTGRNAENGLCGIRVKYLDKEDIESLGFKYVKQGWAETSMIFRDSSFDGVEIYFRNDYTLKISHANNIVRFEGSVKNKSELIKLLKMLNINA